MSNAAVVYSLALVFVVMGTARAQTMIAVDPAVQFQAWQGWGTSLAWWANVVGTFPEPARTDYVTKAFDPVKGLGLNVVRCNIGGGENPQFLAPHPAFLTLRSAVPGFEPSPGQWNWGADTGQRSVLRRAIGLGADQLEAFSNSPPYWMTQSGSVTGNYGGTDNFLPGMVDVFADYLATVVRHYHDAWGITFRTLEPLNEPSGYWAFGNKQEGCHVGRLAQNTVIQRTAEAVLRQGLKTSVAASDEPTIGEADATFQSYAPQTLAGLTQINTHSYGGGDRTQLSTWAVSEGKDLWLSEDGDNDASGLRMSRTIAEDIRGLHPSAWVYWQFVDAAAGWGFLRNPLDSPANPIYTINKKFYVMGQYSRFIRPGSRFIAAADTHSVAAIDRKARTLTLVTTNSGDSPMRVRYDLSKFTRLGLFAEATQTSPTEDLAPLAPIRLENKGLTATLPPQSVTTFVIRKTWHAGKPGLNPRAFYRLFGVGSVWTVGIAAAADDARVAGEAPGQGRGEEWAVVGQGDGTCSIINRRSGLVLDGRGADLRQTRDTEEAGQRWAFESAPGGLFQIVNCGTKRPLTVSGIPAKLWRLVPLAPAQNERQTTANRIRLR